MSRKLTREEEASEFDVTPDVDQKFKSAAVKEIINEVLEYKLTGKTYRVDKVEAWVKWITEQIKKRIKDLGFERYKVRFKIVNQYVRAHLHKASKMSASKLH